MQVYLRKISVPEAPVMVWAIFGNILLSQQYHFLWRSGDTEMNIMKGEGGFDATVRATSLYGAEPTEELVVLEIEGWLNLRGYEILKG